jgi:ribonuclease P protein component
VVEKLLRAEEARVVSVLLCKLFATSHFGFKATNMLPNSQRLSTKQFEEVLKKGRVAHNPLFWLRTLKIQGNTKVSVICPQKIAKSAVKRNEIRRRIYNQIRLFVNNLLTEYQCIVCPKETINKSSDQQINEAIKDIFVKGGLLK